MENEERPGLSVSWVYPDKTLTFPIVLQENNEDEKEKMEKDS